MTDSKLARAKRLQELMAEHPEITKADLARRFGVTPSAVTQWIKNGAINYENTIKLARFFGVSTDWLYQGSGDKVETIYGTAVKRATKDFARIPVFKIEENELVEDIQSNIVAFSQSFLALWSARPETCKLISAINDRMAPTICKSDTVLFMEGDKRISEGEIYVITVDGNLRMCRLAILKNGLSVIYDNPMYQRENFEGPDELSRIKIFGQVYSLVRWF